MPVATQTTIEISHKGAIGQEDLARAVEKVRDVARKSREPVHHIEVRLTLAPSTGYDRPAMAEATIDLHGRMVRSHVGAASVDEAVDGLVDRLRRRLRRLEDRLHHASDRHRTGDSGTGVWRHGDLPSVRPAWTELPEQARELVRRKTFAMAPMSLDEAAFDVEQLDHSFYLFVEAGTDADACIVREPDGSFAVTFAGDQVELSTADVVADVHVADTPAPVLTLDAAREHLDATGDSSVFFVADDSGRGHVMYRRFDGHYGLVGPS